ncbi:HAMP domain-containing sensor histidine kinase [Yeosuana marina]|uniref:HAMP domain-containing sensor histidine kinase n=1 Tax=Yeosuana marina TaxID=1565536 RepID=UPI0030C8B07F
MLNQTLNNNSQKSFFFSYKLTAFFTIAAALVNIILWQTGHIKNVFTGYTINPNATMKVITSLSFILLGCCYVTDNKTIIKRLIICGLLLQVGQLVLVVTGLSNNLGWNLSSGATLFMFGLVFLAVFYIKVKRIRIPFLIINSILYTTASFAVYYYLLDMNELISFKGFETLSWNTSILFFINAISLYEYKLIKRIGSVKLKEILVTNTHPYKYYPFFFLIPIILITTVSVLTYLKYLTIVQTAFFIILFLSVSSFINMFLYSNNFIRFYLDITDKASQLEIKNKKLYGLNLQLKRLNKKINNKNAYLEDFATITSHNLREPIVALSELHKLTNYSALEGTLENKELKEMYNSSIERLNKGIESLIQYHEFIKNEDNPKKETTLLSSSIKSVFNELTPLKPKGTTLTLDIANDLKLTKSYIDDILTNLFTNSFKYKKDREDLKLKIIAYKTNDTYKILFRDNGIGIDLLKNKLNLFKKAKRFHQKSKNSNGYGLYYTKLYVEKLNGTIDIYSKPKWGTALRIQIKLSK